MQHRILGSTGMSVSVIGLGTWQFGGEWGMDFDQAGVDAIFDAARETGINLIDTAECYGDHLSERFIGEAIRRDRDQWIVATKFGHHFHGAFSRDAACTPGDVLRQLEDSLRALQTDYIDLYQFHSGDDELFQTPGLWEALASEVDRGRIRHLGISIGSNRNVFQTERAPSVRAEAIQVIYNRLQQEPEAEVFPACQRLGLGVLARVPLASGFLSGKYAPGSTFPANDVRGAWVPPDREARLAEVQRIRTTEVPPGVDMAAWALAWCLRHPAVTAAIPGCKSPAQVRANAAAASLVDPR